MLKCYFLYNLMSFSKNNFGKHTVYMGWIPFFFSLSSVFDANSEIFSKKYLETY